MPRSAREISNTKVYHIILRGNDKQDIFYDEQDYRKFIKEIKETKEKYQYILYSYCLMPNHVHMVLYDKNESLSKIMQSLEISYSKYFCKKYEKVGHLFQNRFLSKKVETKEYFIYLCRYIHQNPVKAHIGTLNSYEWSSYKEYIGKSELIEKKMLLEKFGEKNLDAIDNFINYHKTNIEDVAGTDLVEFEMRESLTDKEVRQYIQNISKIDNINKIKQLNKKERNEMLRELTVIPKTSRAQIARVLGISKKIVERAMKEE